MKYIKHLWKFYKEVILEDLSKEELVDLITNAKEVKPEVIEEITRVYESYPRYKLNTTLYSSFNSKDGFNSLLNKAERSDLLNIANIL